MREVVGSPSGRDNRKESFSSYKETGKVFSPEMPVYSKFVATQLKTMPIPANFIRLASSPIGPE